MKSFLKYLLATIVGIIITLLILFFIFAGIISSATEEETVELKPNTVLYLELDKPIVDREPDNPLKKLDIEGLSEAQIGLDNILLNIEKAKKNENIKGIFLDLDIVPTGISTIEEIRNALLDFKKDGKFIIAYGEMVNQSAYYLSTAADKVYMNPEGMLMFKGMSAELIFIKGLLEKLEIEPQIIRHGKYKSAVEPLINEQMSEANREQTKAFISSIWNHIITNISESRGIEVADLNKFADSLSIKTPKHAVELKLIDGEKYYDEIIAEIKEKLEIEKDKKLHTVSLGKMDKVPKQKDYKGLAEDKIAVIYAAGTIIPGEGKDNTIGSESYRKAIKKARKDSSIKAIVLRVNSGGGSALASEVIWREIKLAKQDKPVIASFGDVAASGGYYIACGADKILANPNTITGSIGVLGVIPNIKDFLNNKLGITTDIVKTNEHADLMSMTRKMESTEEEFMVFQVEETYKTFVNHVAEGRNMSFDEVDEIGQGRVWSGVDAKRIGLIDEFGGLDRAIEIAVEKSGVEQYRIVAYPEQEDPFEKILGKVSDDHETKVMKKYLGVNYKYYKAMEKALNMQGIQAQMPYFIEIK